jgi:arylsulfatase A-like enzyme
MKLTRRDFLKAAGLLSLAYAAPQPLRKLEKVQKNDDEQNILIILFDAWSASNTSLYGYERRTNPALERLAEKAVVYHNHFAGGHFTAPGTASILTGTFPWTHRAFHVTGKIDGDIDNRNLFHAFRSYHRIAYTHNPLANYLLRNFSPYIDEYIRRKKFYLESDPFISNWFQSDYDTASIGWNRAIKRLEEEYSYALYLSQLYEAYKINRVEEALPNFPRGLPDHDGLEFFTLEKGINGLFSLATSAPEPFLGYYHFYPPHAPYNTRQDFYNRFKDDGYQPNLKSDHPLMGNQSEQTLIEQRRFYDEFLLYVDAEFARLYNLLEQAGTLENTWIVLTSDHGEMFERGILGHSDPVFYQSLMQVPLLIFPPGQQKRVDVYDPTTAADLLATLMHVTGQKTPAWSEGIILPPFRETPPPERDITSVQVDYIDNKGEIRQAASMLVRENHKLMWLLGYGEEEEQKNHIELYETANDPEELDNLYPREKALANELLEPLQQKMIDLKNTY